MITDADDPIIPALDGAEPASSDPLAASTDERDAAARRWLDEHGDILWKFVVARVRSRETAEEIVQETMLGALRAFARFSGVSSERTWLLGIASHKIADHFRRCARHRTHAPDADGPCAGCRGMFTSEGMWSTIPGKWVEPREGTPERSEQVEALRGCIDALPPRQREAVWLCDILGSPAREVREVLGVTETNLWSTMHRARVALRTCVEGKLGIRKEKCR